MLCYFMYFLASQKHLEESVKEPMITHDLNIYLTFFHRSVLAYC